MLVADGDAALVRRPQLRRRILRRRSRAAATSPWHDLSFDLRGELARARRRAVRGRLELRDPAQQRRSPRAGAVPDRAGRRVARAAGAERPRAGRRHGAGAAGLGLLHGAAAHPRRHAVLHSRRDPADGADAGGAARRAGRSRPAGRSNHRLADVARHRPLRDLAARRRAHLVHAASCCTPRPSSSTTQLALAGSANLDLRSLFLNYELMVAFYEPADVARFAEWIERERGVGGALRADASPD